MRTTLAKILLGTTLLTAGCSKSSKDMAPGSGDSSISAFDIKLS